MITIHLKQLLFDAFHGVHEEEKILGNSYEVDCSLEFYEQSEKITTIGETVNYVSVYEVIKSFMKFPIPLLETLTMEIGQEIYKIYPSLKSIKICITKLQPPIEGFRGTVGVCWHKEF